MLVQERVVAEADQAVAVKKINKATFGRVDVVPNLLEVVLISGGENELNLL